MIKNLKTLTRKGLYAVTLFPPNSYKLTSNYRFDSDDIQPPDAYGYRYITITDTSLELVITADPIPEPATMFLFGLGLLGLAGVTRKKK